MLAVTSSEYAIEERYFRWLYSHIGALTDLNPSHSHWLLAEVLHRRAFESTLVNDENRESDGLALRDEFCDEWGSWEGSRFIFEPCTVLEMLIALAKRMDYVSGGSVIDNTGVGNCFWQMMRNAGLDHITDDGFASTPTTEAYVNSVIDRVMYHRYSEKGVGGLFPLRKPPYDVRNMELWYQMNEYVIENS